MSGRTLQRQFRSFLGKTPRTVLRDIRFELARRELLHGSPGSKVMDVAEDCGLTHFGRFSVEYRRRYGETPSQTQKRQAVFVGALASMPEFFVAPRDRPMIALGAIDAVPENGEIARHVTEELAIALMRAGVSVANLPGDNVLPSDRCHQGSGQANAADAQTDRDGNRPSPFGVSFRWRA